MSGASLAGRVVVLTRRPEQGRALREALLELGARVIELPALEVGPPADAGPLDQALRELEDFDWLVFTSANAVRAVAKRLDHLGLPWSLAPRGPRIAVVGKATAQALRHAVPTAAVALQPEAGGSAADLLRAFKGTDVAGARMLLPRSSRGRDELARGLAAADAVVERVVAYQIGEPPRLGEALEQCLAQDPDLFVFASPSAVEGLAAAGPRLLRTSAVAIGRSTEEAIRRSGLTVAAVAREPSLPGLVDAVVRALAVRKA